MESLSKIYDTIFLDSPKNAKMVFDTLFNLGNSLSDERFEYSKDLIINKEKFRCIPKWSYKIIYERKTNGVVIIDIFNSRQHPNKLIEIN